jgi:hypothetical protein
VRDIRLISSIILGILLILTSCDSAGSASHPQYHPRPTATALPPATPTPDPYAWVRHISVPANRLVLYYYIPGAPWGFVGTYNDSDLLARVQAQSQQYASLDPAHPVISGLDIVAPVAQADPGPDGYYSAFPPADLIQHYVDLATQQHLLLFLDMQIGRAPLLPEVGALWQYLQLPNVELALDPEFAVAPDGIPDLNLGHMLASDINPVIDELARLVNGQPHIDGERLPPKILIIHQWQDVMLPDWYNIHPRPGVSVITCSDGFGSPGSKQDDYQEFDNTHLIQYPGIKLFYPNFPGNPTHPTLDDPLMAPADVLALQPSPILVMYQ